MKYLKTFEGYGPGGSGGEDITYGEAMKRCEFDGEIKQYVEDNYPEHGYQALPPKRFITFGKSLGVGQAKKIMSLAKRNKDQKLLELLDKRLKNIEEVELGMVAKKYNI